MKNEKKKNERMKKESTANNTLLDRYIIFVNPKLIVHLCW